MMAIFKNPDNMRNKNRNNVAPFNKTMPNLRIK